MSTYRELHQHIEQHPSLPPEAVIKADLLRRGISFADEALIPPPGAEMPQHQPKSYFIFSFDMVKQNQLDEAHKWRAPEEIALTGGPLELRRTIVSVRLNPESPYRIVVHEGQRWLETEGQKLAQVALPPFPPYYAERLADGRAVAE